ncbi:hypothetical protein PSAB6_30130 [Paraburkholderia sabiae]|nr:hypothetical protein PSAB6_30130 [Paraburkholderia sabiae]
MYVRFEARAGSPCSSSAGTIAEKLMIIKDFASKSQNMRGNRGRMDEKKPELAVRA